MNCTTLFAYLRRSPFGGRLSTAQVRGVETILAVWATTAQTDIRWLAYILATAFHETSATMQPVRETLASSDAKAISILDRAFAAGKLPSVKTPYWRRDKAGKSWLGRGFVQLTHEANYRAASKAAGVDLVADPAKAMDADVAARVLVFGMISGLFTGKRLADYFGNGKDDPVGARRIVNGTDKASLIATYYRAILDALKAADEGDASADAVPALAMPDDKPAAQSGTAWLAAVGPAAGGIAVPLIGGINNIHTLIFSLALLALSGVIIAMFASGRWSINRGGAA